MELPNFAGCVWGIATQYLLGGDHPLVGQRVPKFGSENGTTLNELLRDGHGILLNFEGITSLQNLTSEFSNQLEYVSGRAKEHAGLRALLIRPDGIMAWASDHAPLAVHSDRQPRAGLAIMRATARAKSKGRKILKK